MAKKKKFYVVWNGLNPGIYHSWDDCQAQIKGVKGAVYKSFDSKEEAERAYASPAYAYMKKKADTPTFTLDTLPPVVERYALAVDAACSGNPGIMEYRGVDVKSGAELFHLGPFPKASNNIGEFLALVHGLAMLKKQESPIRTIYSDSVTAMAWVRDRKCKSKIGECAENAYLFSLVRRAEKWLQENTYTTRILKWKTEEWGEIPADFGRK